MVGNLFWGNHLDYFCIKLRSMDAQVLFRLFHAKIIQSTTAITSIVVALATNLKKLVIARFGNAESKQSNQNKCASAHRISPDSWCKKSESKGAVVPPADFLLESELRGSPPKSEKAAAFWRVGGAGRGVQPFLREKTSESNIDCHDSTTNLTQNFRHTERSEVSKSSESNQAQNAMTQERMDKSHRFAQGKKIVGDSRIAKMDSSLTAFAQNDEFVVDCFGDESPRNDESTHDSPLPNLTMTFPRKSPANPPHLRRI